MLENAPLVESTTFPTSGIRSTGVQWHDFYGDHPAKMVLVSADGIHFRACVEHVLKARR